MTSVIAAESLMRDVLTAYPGAQRVLFKNYHLGGCSQCAFQPTDTLGALCASHGLEVAEVANKILSGHEQEARTFIEPGELAKALESANETKLLDVRSKSEFEAAHIEGSIFLAQPVMQEIMAHWPRERSFVIVDHQGKQALDAAAYFQGHGFTNVRCLRGGIDAWAREVDRTVRRYRLESTP